MNWKTFLIGVGAGVAAGIIVNQTVTNKGEISSEKALDIAKSAFKKHGPDSRIMDSNGKTALS